MEMQLVDGPAVRPFICIDGSQAGPVVDTLITHPAYGRMYWPKRLVIEAGRLYGSVTADEHAVVLATVKELEAKLTELEGRLAEIAPMEQAFLNAAARFGQIDEQPELVPRPRRKAIA